MCAKSLQSCLTLCDPVDCGLPGSSVCGILQARILEWLLFLSPEDLPNPAIKPRSPTLQADSLLSDSLGNVGFSNMCSKNVAQLYSYLLPPHLKRG